MKLQFFTVPAKWPEEAQQALNAFCAQHRILTMEKHFVVLGNESYWSICVSYMDNAVHTAHNTSANRREKIDYREILNEADFTVYAQLRELRKTLAEQEGVPAYALFTNEQLADMVTRRVRSETELAKIDGVGKARLEKYGQAFLQRLNTALDNQTAHHAAPAD